jgi:porin
MTARLATGVVLDAPSNRGARSDGLSFAHTLTNVCGLVLLGFGLTATIAEAQGVAAPDVNGITSPSIATSMPNNGDPGGARKDLAARGVTYVLYYTNDVLADVHGGNRRGAVEQGKLEGALTIDLDKAARWQGLSFFANGFAIHNTGRIRGDYVGGINTIAAIEAVPTIRLSELWLEQKLLGGKASVRLGQLAADTEFFFSGLSAMFLQSDWATITAENLPSGGPAYPLSTPGARFKYDPTANISLLFAVFNGDPAGPGVGDPQLRNRFGLNFRIRDPALVMGEAQVRNNTGKQDVGLAGTLKLGAWGHFGSFDDQRLGNDGTLLADPAGSGKPAQRKGNGGVYGVIEQQLYRPAGGDAESGISVYSRISASPSDRNPIDFYVDGGIVFAGLIPRRPNDKFGAGFIYSRFSDSVRAFDRDTAAFAGVPGTLRDFEANLELIYQIQIIPGWIVQPNMQFIWHPNGDADRDAMVVGARSFWQY